MGCITGVYMGSLPGPSLSSNRPLGSSGSRRVAAHYAGATRALRRPTTGAVAHALTAGSAPSRAASRARRRSRPCHGAGHVRHHVPHPGPSPPPVAGPPVTPPEGPPPAFHPAGHVAVYQCTSLISGHVTRQGPCGRGVLERRRRRAQHAGGASAAAPCAAGLRHLAGPGRGAKWAAGGGGGASIDQQAHTHECPRAGARPPQMVGLRQGFDH